MSTLVLNGQEEVVHIGSDWGYNHAVMHGEIPTDWVTGRSTSTRKFDDNWGWLNVQSGPSNLTQYRKRAWPCNKEFVRKRQIPELHGSTVVHFKRLSFTHKHKISKHHTFHNPPWRHTNKNHSTATKHFKHFSISLKLNNFPFLFLKKKQLSNKQTPQKLCTTLTERCLTLLH